MDSMIILGKTGSNMVPRLLDELEQELMRINSLFWVDTNQLKKISQHFVSELNKGLTDVKSDIPMNITWVLGLPKGSEKGTYLTLDLGGTNLRVCRVTLKGEGHHEIAQEQYTMPDELKSGGANDLWEYVAESLEKFIQNDPVFKDYSEEKRIPLGFTFSYPATQHRLDHGILQTWTKGFDIKGVEGEDVGQQLRDAMEKRNLPITLKSIINDTVGAMVASAYSDPSTFIGAIFGTGCNAAYMEACSSIPKLHNLTKNTYPADLTMAINCEYGAFDNASLVLPRTRYDVIIDVESPRPGEQKFEKTSAGLYLGELFRLVLTDLHEQRILFAGQDLPELRAAYTLDTGFLSAIENDDSAMLSSTRALLRSKLQIVASDVEAEFCRRVANMIAVRGARLCACGVAAICKKRGVREGHVAADGSVANKHPHFKTRWAKALGEILDWDGKRKEDPIKLVAAEDGSGVGAAVITAMAIDNEGGWY